MSMKEHEVEWFFQDETAANYGATVIKVSTEIKSFHLWATTSAGTGVIAADVETSNDGVNWVWAANFSIASVATTGTGVIANLSNAFKYFRVNMYTITGTDCTAHANVSYLD